MRFSCLAILCLPVLAFACAAPRPSDDAAESSDQDLSGDGTAADDMGCSGPVLSSQAVMRRFAPGGSMADFGGYRISGRQRVCTTSTGCSAWSNTTDGIKERADVGVTTLLLSRDTGGVALSFAQLRQDPWLADVPLGTQPDANAMGRLLEDPAAFTYSSTPIRERCVAMRAKKSVPVDGVTTKETEITLSASHSADVSVDPYFTTEREMAFDCHVYRVGYQWCGQRIVSDGDWDGTGLVKLSADGKKLTYEGKTGAANWTSGWNKEYTLTEQGTASWTTTYDITTVTFGASAAGKVVRVDLTLDTTWAPDQCGGQAESHYKCSGVLIAP